MHPPPKQPQTGNHLSAHLEWVSRLSCGHTTEKSIGHAKKSSTDGLQVKTQTDLGNEMWGKQRRRAHKAPKEASERSEQ